MQSTTQVDAIICWVLLSGFSIYIIPWLLRNGWAMRHAVAIRVIGFTLTIAFCVGLPVAVLLLAHLLGIPGTWVFYPALAGGFILIPYLPWKWLSPIKRSRRIPASVRRRVIAKWAARTGLVFNPKIHELDHKYPFGKGGGHTLDNLRIVPRGTNRSKGGKVPMPENWIRMWRQRS